MTTPTPNPVGPELNVNPQTVTSHMTPRSSPYHWSKVRPTVNGFYWCRRPNISNSGWDTRCCKAWQRNPAEVMQIAWQHDLVLLVTDVFWDVAQFSYEAVPEPL
jgi:hypothetical protein